MNVIMVVGQLTCDGHEGAVPKLDAEIDLLCSETGFWDPTSRVNRSCRFVLFLATLQWAQVWIGLFPSWHRALASAESGVGRWVLWILLPLSLLRFSMWFLRPAGSGVVHFFSGIRHHLVDSIFVAGWSIWLLLTAIDVSRPKSLGVAGFTMLLVTDNTHWKAECTLFKFTIFFWQLLHFLRGCVALGPAYAQNDLIVISLLYPTLLCVVWTMTFIVVSLSHFGANATPFWTWMGVLLGAGVLLGMSFIFCRWVDLHTLPGLVACVWLHFCRQAFRVVRRLVVSMRYAKAGTVKFALAPQSNTELSTTYQLERKLGRVAVRSLLLILASFLATLAGTILMAGVQQRQGLFLNDVVWWKRLSPPEPGVQITNSKASVLTLNLTRQSGRQIVGERTASHSVLAPEETPHYAVCGHTWYGLQLVDYAFMTEVAYMDNKPENDLQGLLSSLFPHMDVRLKHSSAGPRRWLDIEVHTCKDNISSGMTTGCQVVTVIAVSGTDPTRVVDYAENLRMWTEPVALKILSTVFPTVRIWPRDTTAMVITAIHKILKGMAVQDEQWHYREILEHVRKIKPGREVVITGHSLGGGIALVVGALTGHLGVAIQPPGVYHSLAKHQAQQLSTQGSALHRRSVSVVFEGDWVQHFDEHGGLVQTMTCDQSASVKSIAVGCHLLEGAIAHLLWHCGDHAQRFESCAHEYQPVSTILTIAESLVALARDSWASTQWFKNKGSIVYIGATVSFMMVLRHGALPTPWQATGPVPRRSFIKVA